MAGKVRGQIARFALVGVLSTLCYVGVYAASRAWLTAQVSNLVALLLSALANTAINRRFTFGHKGRTGFRVHAQGLAVFAVGVVLTSGALVALHAATDKPGRLVEVAVLLMATAMATAVRFLFFRWWIFRESPPIDTLSGGRVDHMS